MARIKKAEDEAAKQAAAIAAEQKRTELAKERMILCMEQSLGIVSNACRMAKIGRTTYYEWLNGDLVFAARIAEVENLAIDFSESALFTLIKGAQVPEDKIFVNAKGKKTIVKTMKIYPPDTQAVMFHLQTKGKKRGYIKSSEIEIPDDIKEIRITRRVINSKDDLKK